MLLRAALILPPLNTAGESQDCTAVAENYLWWEICEGNEYRGVQERERVVVVGGAAQGYGKEVEGRGRNNNCSFKHFHICLLWSPSVTFGHRSVTCGKREEKVEK